MEGLRKGIGLLLSRRDRVHFRSLYAVLVVGAILEVLSLASITLFISLLVPSDSAPGGAREIYLRALESAFGESPAAVVWGAVGVALALNLVRTLWNVMFVPFAVIIIRNLVLVFIEVLLKHQQS